MSPNVEPPPTATRTTKRRRRSQPRADANPKTCQEHPADPTVPSDAQLRHLRFQRLREYHANALSHPDPLLASLGSINASLMLEAMAISEAIATSIGATAPDLDHVMNHLDPLELHVKITRQIDRLAHLEFDARRREAEEDDELPKQPR